MLMNEKTVRPRGEGDAQFRALHDTPPTSLAHVSGRRVQLEQERSSTRSLSSREQGGVKDALDHDVDQHARELRDGERPQVRRAVLGRQQGQSAAWSSSRPTRFADPVVTPDASRRCRTSARTRSTIAQQRTSTSTRSSPASTSARSVRTPFHVLAGYEQRQSDVRRRAARSRAGRVQQRPAASRQRRRVVPGHGQRRDARPVSSASSRRFNYGWNNRYLARGRPQPRRLVAVRAEQASTAPSRRRRSPGASRTSRSSSNHIGFVNDLKLRGSWGRLGNDRIDDYLFQQTININSGNYAFNNALVERRDAGPHREPGHRLGDDRADERRHRRRAVQQQALVHRRRLQQADDAAS